MTSGLYTRSFIVMAVANLSMASGQTTFFLLPLFITERGGTKTEVGVIMGTMALTSVLCRPWISRMVDQIGRKRSYTIGSLASTLLPVAYLLFAHSGWPMFPSLLLIRLAHGVAAALVFTAMMTYIVDIVPSVRLNEGLGMFGVSGLTGMALGPVFGELVLGQGGFSALFWTATGLSGLALALHLPLPETYVREAGQSSSSFTEVLSRKKVVMVAVLGIIFGVGLAAYGNFVTPFGRELKLPLISLFYLAYSTAAVLTRIFGSRLADRVGEARVVPYALGCTGLGILTLAFINGTTLLIVSGLVTGAGHGFLFPSLNALALRGEPMESRGQINGIYYGAIDAGAFLGAIILGQIGDWIGFRAIFTVAGLALLSGLYFIKKVQAMAGPAPGG